MNKKGFTLIELLAVIVVLAIIALIATPMVLNTIDEARRGAASSSALAYVSAVETKIALNMLSGTSAPASVTATDFASVKGDAPEAVDLTVTNGAVSGGTITVNGYTFTYSPSTGMSYSA